MFLGEVFPTDYKHFMNFELFMVFLAYFLAVAFHPYLAVVCFYFSTIYTNIDEFASEKANK
jgi:hypothetical protein